jgi:hypothetical protein
MPGSQTLLKRQTTFTLAQAIIPYLNPEEVR